MANNDKTSNFYQRLNKLMNLDGMGFQDNIKQSVIPHNEKIIIKGNSQEEIYKKGLELEQKRLLQNKFGRTTDRSYQKALQYEAGRLQAYIDFEGMEYYPLISSALDLFMEEATTIGMNGKMLNIYSNKERIKLLLEDFFNDIVNVNVNLPFWVRNLCKYGDNFVNLYGERRKGIILVKQLVNYEIERLEKITNGKPTINFKERMTGDQFNAFEIAHFRLLGDDKFIPYGSSILNKVRRVFRQLIMSEDAMLTYRLIRAGEKKVFRIDVGNIDDDDVEAYIHKVATSFKKTGQIQPNDGQIDYRFNILGNDEDYFLPVRNSNTQSGIDVLPGANNLNDIHDIEYLRDNLFIGLGIPKPFLSFQDAAGGGKNLAQFDIRFQKKVNRIQQAMIQELNKMAMIHLYYLGYDASDLTNFTLTLANPSTQQELLKSELMRDKAQTYNELTRSEAGIAALSHTSAKKIIFNMSDREIVDDLKQQKMEKTIAQELQDAPLVIKKTGIFTDIDNKYGEPIEGQAIGGETGVPEGNVGTPPEGEEFGVTQPETGAMPPTGGLPAPPETGGLPPVAENKRYFTYRKISDNEFNDIVEKLVYGDNKIKLEKEKKKIIIENEEKNLELNNKAQTMITEIEDMLKKSEKSDLEGYNNIEEIYDISIDDIGNID